MRISDWSSDVCSSDLRVAQSVRAPVQEEGAGVALSREVCLGERVVLFAVGIAAAGDDAAGKVELGATGEGVAGGVDQAVLAGTAGADHQDPVALASLPRPPHATRPRHLPARASARASHRRKRTGEGRDGTGCVTQWKSRWAAGR